MRKGFTLVEIMIVVAIIALLAAIAIPNLLRARLNANESAAISNIQTISTAAQSYWSAEGGLPGNFSAMENANPAYMQFGGTGTARTKNGYNFTVTGGTTANVWYARANPTTAGTTGNRRFCVTATGIIRVNTSNNIDSIATCNASDILDMGS